MTQKRNPTADVHWHVRRNCDLSAQFYEAYAAYASRPAVRSSKRSVADEVEMFLICHALELALKGWLMLREPGMTAKDLKNRYRHDLEGLALAVEPHYPDIEAYRVLIFQLNTSYKNKGYEYPDLEQGYAVPMPLKPYADFTAKCRFDLSQAIECERSGGDAASPAPSEQQERR